MIPLRWGLQLAGCLLVLAPLTAFGQNTTASAAVDMFVSGAPQKFTLDPTVNQRWYRIGTVTGRSYCVELTNADFEQRNSDTVVEVFNSDGVTLFVSNDDVFLEPFAGFFSSRACFIETAGQFRLIKGRLFGAGSPAETRSYTLRVVETTLFCAWYFLGGNPPPFDAFIQFRNTTNSNVSFTITWRNTAGVIQGTTSQAIPGNGTFLGNAKTFVPSATSFGGIDIAHNSSPDALVAMATSKVQTTIDLTALVGSGGLLVGGANFDAPCARRATW